MSQRCVGYVGDGKARRPIWRDEGPASASIARQLGEGKTALLDGLPDRSLEGAGPVERRQITEAERAVRARPVLDPVEEEPAMVVEEPAQIVSTESPPAPERGPESIDAPENPYVALADAAIETAEAWTDLQKARERFDAAQAACEARMQTVERVWDLLPLVHEAIVQEARASVALDGQTQVVQPIASPSSTNIPETIPEPPAAIGGGSGHPVADPAAGILTKHQRKVLETTIRHAGDRKAVAEELGVRREGVEVVLEAIGRKGFLPADLIAVLPARFAKYTAVSAS